MAHTVNFLGDVSKKQFTSYNIGGSVGSPGTNIPVDVKLIQALLRMVFSELEGSRPAVLANDEPLVLDGIYGPITHRHLRAFKDEMRRANFPTVADGKIDPFPSPKAGTITRLKQKFVLNKLNDLCDTRAGEQGKSDLYQKLGSRDDIPEDLRSALKTVVFEP